MPTRLHPTHPTGPTPTRTTHCWLQPPACILVTPLQPLPSTPSSGLLLAACQLRCRLTLTHGGGGRAEGRLVSSWKPSSLTALGLAHCSVYTHIHVGTHRVTNVPDAQWTPIHVPLSTDRHAPVPDPVLRQTCLHTHAHVLPLSGQERFPSSTPSSSHLVSHPHPPFPAQGGDRHLRACQLLPHSGLGPPHVLCLSVHRGLVGDAGLPVYCALAPSCGASSQSHRGPRAWALHPEDLRPHPLPGAPTPQLGWDLREYPAWKSGCRAVSRGVGGRTEMWRV